MPADYDDNSVKPDDPADLPDDPPVSPDDPPASPDDPPASPKSVTPSAAGNSIIIPTDTQWGELKEEVLRAAHEYLGANQISDDEGDPNIDGHPIAWVLNRARGFESNFKEHRMPKHPSDEEISTMGKKTLRKTMQTYGQRLVRANAPPEIQKKAAWRNFVARTARLVDRLISNGQVPPSSPLFGFPKAPKYNESHFTLVPTPKVTDLPSRQRGGVKRERKFKQFKSLSVKKLPNG